MSAPAWLVDLLTLERPENRPASPNSRPAESRATAGESPKSPKSPNTHELDKASSYIPTDPDVERRRAKALALLDADPERQIAVVAEAGDPAHVAVAIRGAVVGELEIGADRYDGFALLALMQQHGHA